MVVSGSIAVSAGAPSLMAILTQPSTSAASGVPFIRQPVVQVRDQEGNPTAGVNVTAAISSGGPSLGGTTTALTDGDGVATFSNLSLTGEVGERTLSFSAGSASIQSGTIVLDVGPLARLVITLQPSSSATNAVPFPQQPSVRAEDDFGNPVGGVAITAAIQSGGGTLGGTTMVNTSASGVAAFTNLSITGLVGARTLRFSNAGINVTSNTIAVGPGAPASVVIMTQPPETSVSGSTFTRSPVVEVEDVSGNAVPGEDVVATIASGGGTLGGTKTITTSGSGTATFTSLSITGSPGARTLRFSANGLQTVSSSVHVSYAAGPYLDLQYCGSAVQQRMDVYVPSNSFARPLPVAAFIHGGGWVSGDKADGLLFDEVKDLLLLRGYVVVSLNYRLATESTNKWPAQINDVKCAVRHLRAEAGDYGFDGVRIGVWGVSSGGHLASMLGLTDSGVFEGSGGYAGVSSRVTAAVAVGGISDLTGGPDHTELNFIGPANTFTTWPGPSTQLTNASPITYETADDPPFLLVHGGQDTTVFPAQATRLFDQLDAVGVDVTLEIVANGGHNLEDVGAGTPSMSIAQVALVIADFFDFYISGDP
jgi:acetyl esterase/lipase